MWSCIRWGSLVCWNCITCRLLLACARLPIRCKLHNLNRLRFRSSCCYCGRLCYTPHRSLPFAHRLCKRWQQTDKGLPRINLILKFEFSDAWNFGRKIRKGSCQCTCAESRKRSANSHVHVRIRVVSVLFPFGQVVSARVVSARFLGWVVSAQLGRVVSALFHRWVVSARFLGWVVSAWFIYNGQTGKILCWRQKLKNTFPFGKFRLLTTL